MGNDQVLVQHRLMNLVLIGIAHECVVTERKKRLDRIRILIGHGTKHLARVRHMAAHHDIGVGISPDFFRGPLEHLGHPIRIGGVLFISQLFGLLLIREHLVKRQFGLRNHVWIEAAQRLTPHASKLPVTARKIECKRIADVDEICISVIGVQGMMAPSAVA